MYEMILTYLTWSVLNVQSGRTPLRRVGFFVFFPLCFGDGFVGKFDHNSAGLADISVCFEGFSPSMLLENVYNILYIGYIDSLYLQYVTL